MLAFVAGRHRRRRGDRCVRPVFAFVDSYGGAPGAGGYEARITLRASDGTGRSATARITADAWNRVTVGVRDWSSRRAVTELEVGFRAIGSDTPWVPHFQVDFADRCDEPFPAGDAHAVVQTCASAASHSASGEAHVPTMTSGRSTRALGARRRLGRARCGRRLGRRRPARAAEQHLGLALASRGRRGRRARARCTRGTRP